MPQLVELTRKSNGYTVRRDPDGLDRLPPQSLEAESCTLGAMLLGGGVMAEVVETLRPEDFYRDAHRFIYEAALRLFDHSEPVDLLTVSNELQGRGKLEAVGGAAYLHTLTEQTPYAVNVPHYAKIVRDKALRRRLLATATHIAERCYDSEPETEMALDQAERDILNIAQERVQKDFSRLRPLLEEAYNTAEARFQSKSFLTGLATGFEELDRKTAGLQKADLVVVAGRPSMGKTSLAMNIAAHVALGGQPVGVFSLEMSKEQLIQGLLCAEAKIDMQRFRTGYFQQDDWEKMSRAIQLLYDAPLFIDDTPALTALELRAKARRLKAEHGLSLVIVDYLQLMRGHTRTENRVQEVSEITRSLKALARELDVPVIATAQLSRAVEQRPDKRPMLSDLRESGQIEADADVVAFIYRPSYYQRKGEAEPAPTETIDEAEIILGKQRNGPVGTVKLGFIARYKRFVALSPQTAPASWHEREEHVF